MMIRLNFTLFLTIFITFTLKAQMISPEKKIFSEEPFFNENFIKHHKIKAITTEMHFKRDGEKMLSKNMLVHYEFDLEGKLHRQLTVFNNSEGEKDTSFIYFEYDSLGRWSTKRTTDNFGFYSLTFNYDDQGNIIEEIFNRELNATASKSNFILAKQYPMGIERYNYSYITPDFYKKHYLNNLGVPFKEVSVVLNPNGQPVEETGVFLSTRRLEKRSYTYNEEGRLVEKSEFSDVTGNVNFHYQYRYDLKGNLLEIIRSKNSEPVLITEFMFSEQGMITARLSRNKTTKIIDIDKFSYEFY